MYAIQEDCLWEWASRYLRSLGWFVDRYEHEDLVGEFVFAGLDAVGGDTRRSGLFITAGRRRLMELMRASRRIMRARFREVSFESLTSESTERCRTRRGCWAVTDDKLTLAAILDRANLSPNQQFHVDAFLNGERCDLWGNGDKTREGMRLQNAMYKAILKLRKVASATSEAQEVG